MLQEFFSRYISKIFNEINKKINKNLIIKNLNEINGRRKNDNLIFQTFIIA